MKKCLGNASCLEICFTAIQCHYTGSEGAVVQVMGEVEVAILDAKKHPAMGVAIQKVSPEKPYVGFWHGSNGLRFYVKKIVYSTGFIQGAATAEMADAVGYSSVIEAAEEIASLGYAGSYMQFAPYVGQLRLF
ncbi:hypothetical protein [Pseudomonas sp. NPDC096950]|uniref:hypothetical protein n=1 Tax=Pseudomonas sp. NPDC096950 TaxID=3364485 RepID=UPI00383A0024